MTERLSISFAALDAPLEPTTVLLAGTGLDFGATTSRLDGLSGGAIQRAAAAAPFKGATKTSIELLALPGGVPARILLVGLGKPEEAKEADRLALGGSILAQMEARKTSTASLVAEIKNADGISPAVLAADLAFGIQLRSYEFKKYLTKKPDDVNEQPNGLTKVVVHTADPAAAEAAFRHRRAVSAGVFLARDLVNEPANHLGPEEFAERARSELSRAGVEVEVLDVPKLEALGMGSLLSVGQGSVRPSRVVVMQWHGANGGKGSAAKAKKSKPVCFVGKGVVFDTGGISMKPAAGMEDMKGDMAGAACVTGLMLALAMRKAPVNAVGLIGLVENMPSGSAMRPGDIVTSMSGQTIEVLNTDAEGRLVLADVLWYAQERFKPKLIVDLATLTGAIMVALGKEYAGLFSNDDTLAANLHAAGEETGERVWRMPMAKAYDKLIDSKNADMKNIGGRYGGAITAAQFIQRFIKDTPWAHLDIAGTGMDSTRNDTNQSWGSGWGVRLLDRLTAEHHEKG